MCGNWLNCQCQYVVPKSAVGLRPAGLAVGREDDLAVGEQGQSGSQKGELGPPGGCISLDPMLLFHFFQAHDIDALR